jgi:hypothetical protein
MGFPLDSQARRIEARLPERIPMRYTFFLRIVLHAGLHPRTFEKQQRQRETFYLSQETLLQQLPWPGRRKDALS